MATKISNSEKKRKLEYGVINGKKCERYEGDDGWVVCKEQA